MGSGLSDLQRWILTEARKVDRLYYADICEGYYGWPRKTDRSIGQQQFSKSEIGHREYNRVMATISRSCLRLDKRGLVHCLVAKSTRWSGVEAITQKGGSDE